MKREQKGPTRRERLAGEMQRAAEADERVEEQLLSDWVAGEDEINSRQFFSAVLVEILKQRSTMILGNPGTEQQKISKILARVADELEESPTRRGEGVRQYALESGLEGVSAGLKPLVAMEIKSCIENAEQHAGPTAAERIDALHEQLGLGDGPGN